MRPELNIVLANHWQFANEYWGAVRGYGRPYRKRPNYYVFELYAQHFGDVLIQAEVECPRFDTEGGWGVLRAVGAPRPERLLGEDLLRGVGWSLLPGAGFQHSMSDGVLRVEFFGEDVNYYQAVKEVPALPNAYYRLSGWVRTDITEDSGARLEILDGRGWDATHSSASSECICGATDWTRAQVDYKTLADATSVQVRARRWPGNGPVPGWVEFRDLQLHRLEPFSYGAQPLLGVNASKSKEGRRVYLMMVNKAITQPLAVVIEGVKARAAHAWCLSGPRVDSTNEEQPDTVAVRPLPLAVQAGRVGATLPPHSVTALEIRLG